MIWPSLAQQLAYWNAREAAELRRIEEIYGGSDYSLAPDEQRDAYINDCDAGSGEGEE